MFFFENQLKDLKYPECLDGKKNVDNNFLYKSHGQYKI